MQIHSNEFICAATSACNICTLAQPEVARRLNANCATTSNRTAAADVATGTPKNPATPEVGRTVAIGCNTCDTRSRSHRGDRLQHLQHQPIHEVVAGEDLKTNCPAKTSKRVHKIAGRGCGRLVGLFVLRPASTRKRSSDLPCDDLVLARPNGCLPSRPHRPLQPGLSRRQQPTNESTKSARCYRPFLRRRNVRLKPARNSHLKQIVQWSF